MTNTAQKYRYEFVEHDAFMVLFNQYQPHMFGDTGYVDISALYDADEMQTRRQLADKRPKGVCLCLVVYDGDVLAGWSLAEQDNGDIIYMRNSAVLPQYRRQGIYTAMLRMMVERAVETGFQQIRSRHLASNNAVLIPKLAFGFYIRGMEICDRYGVMALLSFYPHEKRKALFRYRSGENAIHPLESDKSA